MDALALLVHLIFKTFFLALPVGVAWLAFRRLSMSESQNAWLYSAVALFSSVSAAGLAPWALGFTGVSWLVLIAALMCPLLWMATVLLCDLRQRSYGDEDATDWVIERFTSSRAEPEARSFEPPLVLRAPIVEAEAPAEEVMPVFRHVRPEEEPVLTFEEPTKSEESFEDALLAPSIEDLYPSLEAAEAEPPAPEPYRPVAEKTEREVTLFEEAEEPVSEEPELIDESAFPIEPTAYVKNAFLGSEVEPPRKDEPRRVLDVARDMRGDGAPRERLMRKVKSRDTEMPILSGTA